MAGIARNVMRLLLFSFIRVKGEDGLMFPGGGYDIAFPCEEDLVCMHVWHLRTPTVSEYIAIVINGEVLTAKSEDDGSKCALQIGDPAEVVGRRRCQNRPDVFSPLNTVPDFNLAPGKSMSMQCILLAYVQQGHCETQWRQRVSLTWVDEAGAEVRGDAQHRIKRESSCDTTLTVTLQSPGDKRFRCKATVGGRVRTSEELWVRVPALKGRGRGMTIDLQPENPNQDGNRSTIGTAVGVVGCVALTALVAAFVVRRRMSNQRRDESHANDNDSSADDVVYTDVILPVGSRQAWAHESTEYACVKYK